MPHLYEFFAVLYNLCRFCLAALLRAYDISPLVHIRTGSVLRVTVLRGVINTFSVWDGRIIGPYWTGFVESCDIKQFDVVTFTYNAAARCFRLEVSNADGVVKHCVGDTGMH